MHNNLVLRRGLQSRTFSAVECVVSSALNNILSLFKRMKNELIKQKKSLKSIR